MSNLRIGIAGLGGHGGNIQRSAAASELVEVVAVCDPNRAVLDEAIARFGCDGFEDYDAMLESDAGNMDAVVLVTPNHLHRRQAEEAFAKGLHVMVEKPIANTVTDGVAMIEAARTTGKTLYVGHNMRFSRAYWRMRDLVDAGVLGDVITAEIHFSADNTRWLPKDAWRLQPSLCPLMPVMQLGVHGIDVVQSMLGRIVSVSAFADAFTTEGDVIDSVVAAVRFESGTLGTIVSNYCTQVAFDFRISGTEGTVYSTPHRGWFRRAVDTDSQCEGPVEDFNFLQYHGESFELQMDAFARRVSHDEPAGASTGDALSAVAVVEALEKSIADGRSVSVQQVNDDGLLS